MRIRSLLFVPGDRPDRMRKALSSGADALILDLEDSVAAAAKESARGHVATFLKEAQRGPKLFVRVNALQSGFTAVDLDAVLFGQPDGIMLPKAEGAADIAALDAMLNGTEARILPVVTETPKALFALGSYAGASSRLCGLTWGAEDLSAAVGASTARDEDGRYQSPYELARCLTLFAAHAAGVVAVDTIYPNFADLEGLSAYARRARQDGFGGMMAIHPSQIAPIHEAFRPSEAELAEARQIVDLFAAHAGVGALNLNGRMIDAPHLAEARRLIEQARPEPSGASPDGDKLLTQAPDRCRNARS